MGLFARRLFVSRRFVGGRFLRIGVREEVAVLYRRRFRVTPRMRGVSHSVSGLLRTEMGTRKLSRKALVRK